MKMGYVHIAPFHSQSSICHEKCSGLLLMNSHNIRFLGEKCEKKYSNTDKKTSFLEL